ncbi:MAG: hypothetical protein MNPFHGCM_00353 [Gemmatimonadaceae bacterium]|nr:hypothetical protein [Gemmatimonadaceae bacterium]
MASRRVLVGPLPALLSGLVQQLRSDSVGLIGLLSSREADIVTVAVVDCADVMLTALDDTTPELSLSLHRRLQHAAIVAIDARGHSAVRFVAGTAATRIDDLSPPGLRSLIDDRTHA